MAKEFYKILNTGNYFQITRPNTFMYFWNNGSQLEDLLQIILHH